MTMSKPMDEKQRFELFRAAYERVTGQWLEKQRETPHPTYVCARPDESLVGVEFTQLIAPSGTKLVKKTKMMEGSEGADLIQNMLVSEVQRLHQPDWQLSEASILVMATSICPISEMELFFSRELEPELAKRGFTEIWVADYTEVAEYNSIELFGLFPRKWWGYHPHPWKKKESSKKRFANRQD